MKAWEEPPEQLWRVLTYTAGRVIGLINPQFRGRRGAELRRILPHAAHNLRRIVLRTRGVVIISSPKSGRTWLRFMLDRLGLHVQYTHAFGALSVPTDLPRRMILLHRDPRDTVVSAWFQHRKRRKDYDGSLSEFLRDPLLGIEQRVLFNLFWAEQVHMAGGCIIAYEDLHIDPVGALTRIATFIARKAPQPMRVRSAIADGAFDRMRAVEASGEGARLYGNALRPSDAADPDSYKTREGKIGGWLVHFSAEDTAFADEAMRRHDYSHRMANYRCAGGGLEPDPMDLPTRPLRPNAS